MRSDRLGTRLREPLLGDDLILLEELIPTDIRVDLSVMAGRRPGHLRTNRGAPGARRPRYALLHDDRDFAPMQEHLGLMVA